MDAAYKNATTKRDALAAEINLMQQRLEEARRDLERIDTFLREWVKFAGVDPNSESVDNSSGAPAVTEKSGNTPKPRPKNPPKEEVIDAAVSILREHGEPMSRAELFKALRSIGITLQGTDPEMVLSTMMWRMKDKIVRIPDFGYWPTDLPYPPAGYIPLTQLVDDYRKMSEAVAEAERSYYQNDQPKISDAEYDSLKRRLAVMEANHPELKKDIFG